MSNYRNKKILDSARDAPHCFGCGKDNHGQVVAAHANWLEYGKGRGIKAHDIFVAHLCNECHYLIDEGNLLTKQEKKDLWDRAFKKTLLWMVQTGILK